MRTLVRVLAILLVLGLARFLFAAVAGMFAPAAYTPGGPPPTATVTATDPGPDARLGDYQALYVRLFYTTTQPVYLNLDGVAGGEVVRREMTGGMYRAQAGSGEAALWIAFPAGTSLDALRVEFLDLRERPVASTDLPAHFDWVAGNLSSPNPRPDWVARFQAAQQRPTPASPPTILQLGLGTLVAGAPLAYVALQIWFGIAWRDGWRPTALMPLVVVVPAVLWSAYAAADNSNLAFLPVALAAPLALLYLLIAALLRFVAKRLA